MYGIDFRFILYITILRYVLYITIKYSSLFVNYTVGLEVNIYY